jgi:peptide/nickel transport system substrate-binding protein
MRIGKALLVAGLLALGAGPVGAQQKGGIVNVATVGEPPTLDPMVSTADLVGIITQHFFETLFTFDKNWKVTPLLAESMPDISEDGKVYTIKLRQGVTFHDGSPMTSEDVLASLKRWTELASRGKQTATIIDKIEALDPATVRITLKAPYAPLLALLSFNNAAAVIMPAKKMENPLSSSSSCGSTATSRARASPTATAARASNSSTRSGSCRFPIRTRGSRARSPGNTTTSTRCRSRPSSGSRARRRRSPS